MELKEGQRLRVKEFDERPNHWSCVGKMDEWMGKIVTLESFENDNKNITICEDKDKFWWRVSDFQIVFDTWRDVENAIGKKMFGMECYVLEDEKMKNGFKLSDLKDEMVVETRNNNRYLVFDKIFLGLNGFMSMESYSEDFKFIMEDKDFDIIAVYPKYGNYGYGFNGILYNVKEPIWQEPITKDVSLEEINELLKEKYPDVEKFNLPIDNDK